MTPQRVARPVLWWLLIVFALFSSIFVLFSSISMKLRQVHAQDPRATFGQWTTLPTLPFFPVHDHLLPTGKVMIWPGDADSGGISGNDPRLWNPADASVTPLAAPGYDVFCTGHAFLADGRLFVAGGHIHNLVGLSKASLYNPSSNTWAAAPDMNAGRWYPTVTTLANGDALVVSGYVDTTVGINTLPQVYETATNSWRSLTSAQLTLDEYPMMFLAPNGQVVNVGPVYWTRYLNTSGTGAWSYFGDTKFFNVRGAGSAVMYADGKILLLGGGDPPTNTAEVIDLNQPSPTWRFVGNMTVARRQVNATLLPDGTVLVTGGTSCPGANNADPGCPVLSAELWDPATESFQPLASATVPRLYHSAAVLLPDGRVLTTGGNGYPTPEAFSPPYLFKGARPTMSAVPSTIGYGQHFSVQTPDAASITKVRLIRIASVTHAFDQNQRLSVLSFTPGSSTLDIVAPATGNVAPPGHYLLFIVNSNGVPSIGNVVQLGGAPGPPPPPPPTYPVTVSTSGTGTGTVTGAGSYVAGATVTLTASPTGGSTFSAWSPSPCASSFTMPANALACVASFTAPAPPPGSFLLTVSKTGSGTVTSDRTGINCGSDCSESYTAGTVVTLTATANRNARFLGWGGACSGTGTCTVTMNAARSVTATFRNR